jgi:hypothetical protein
MQDAGAMKGNSMTRAHLILMLAVIGAMPLASCDWSAPAPTAAELVDGVEHAKLLHLLESFRDIEVTLHQQQSDLIKKYGSVEVTNVYEGIDLTKADGIRQARQRLQDFSAIFDAFAGPRSSIFRQSRS